MDTKLPIPLCTIGRQRNFIYLNIYNVDENDRTALHRLDPSSRILTDRSKGPYIYFIKAIYPKTIDKAKAGDMVLSETMINAVEYLNNCGKYANVDIDILNSEACAIVIGEGISKEQRAELEKNIDDLWEEIIKKMHTSRVKELLTSLEAFVNTLPKNAQWFGHQISFKNGLLAMSQRPDVQFVATRDNWKRLYNRQVKPNAKPIYLYAKIDKTKFSDDDVKNAEVAKYGQNYNMSRMQKYKTKVDMHFRNQGLPLVPYFDVKDTEIYNPNDKDYFNDEQGLSNNITGKLNYWAQKEQMESPDGIDPEIEKELTKTFDLHKEEAKPAFNALSRAVKKNFPSIHIPKVQDGASAQDYVVEFSKLCNQVADTLITQLMQVIKPENKTPKVNAVTSIVMLLGKFMPVTQIKPINDKNLIRQDYLDVRSVVIKIVNLINANMLPSESKLFETMEPIPNITSDAQFEDILSQLGVDVDDIPVNKQEDDTQDVNKNIQEIKNKFFTTLNKLNIP